MWEYWFKKLKIKTVSDLILYISINLWSTIAIDGKRFTGLYIRVSNFIMKQTPYSMLQTIAEHLEQENSLETHERLLPQAQGLTKNPKETIKEYLERHITLRNEMRRSKYPTIDQEKLTITFMVFGLSTWPLLQAIVPTLLVQKPSTIRDLRNTSEILDTIILHTRPPPNQTSPRQPTTKWCEIHRS